MISPNKEEIFHKISEILADDFEIPNEDITLTATLFEDLDLDSIDAVDLAVRLQKETNKKISPDKFKEIRTVSDVVDNVYDLLK